MTQEKLIEIASQFAIEGEIASVKALGEGFINDTFVVATAGDAPDYILQRKNHIVFPDVPGMMDNIKAVLPIGGAFALIGISMLLTLIAGIIPSRIASKKDPVEALRSE